MPKYQIVTPHLASECVQAFDDMIAHDSAIVSELAFGCHFGDHTGYAVVEAENEDEVRSRLPQSILRKARIVEVEYFDPEEIRASHDRSA